MKTKLNTNQIVFVCIFALALIITAILNLWPKNAEVKTSGKINPEVAFAACLTAKGITMYGTDICENCQKQKMMFGEAFKKILYINCDIHQQECAQNGVQGYPTWVYNEKRLLGVQTFKNLGNTTGCQIPEL